MNIKLIEVEPYALQSIDSHTARLFLGHLNGSETFSFNGQIKPKSICLYDINYKYPRLSSAHGFLLSINIDAVDNFFKINPTSTWTDVFNKFKVGEIHIDLGGNLSAPKIYT
jgi:hypothetical protein